MAAFSTARRVTQHKSYSAALRLPGVGAVAAAALVTAAALLPVVQSSTATSAGSETRKMEQYKSDLQASIYNAQMEVAQLGAISRVDREARERLGMVPADQSLIAQVTVTAPAASHVPARFVEPAESRLPPRRVSWADRVLAKLSDR